MPLTPPPRSQMRIDTGNVLELAGAGVGCYAIAQLAGVAWALVAAAALIIVAAELVYDGHSLRIPLPRRPRPLVRARRLAGATGGALRVAAAGVGRGARGVWRRGRRQGALLTLVRPEPATDTGTGP